MVGVRGNTISGVGLNVAPAPVGCGAPEEAGVDVTVAGGVGVGGKTSRSSSPHAASSSRQLSSNDSPRFIEAEHMAVAERTQSVNSHPQMTPMTADTGMTFKAIPVAT